MIVVYGGALSPITLAHEKIIRDLSKEFKVVVMPVGDKYEKNDLLPSEDRLKMLNCLDFNENVSISTIEIDNPNILHTYETLTLLKKEYPNENIKFVTGSDNLVSFHTWGNAKEILEEFGLLVIKRDGFDFDKIVNNDLLLSNYVHNIVAIELDIEKGISSTKLRKLLREKTYNLEELNKYVDNKVLNYILENKLFENEGDM